MRKEQSYSMDMCNGSILPKIMRFSIPLMCSGILQLLFNAMDVVVVGRFGSEHSLAAVGSTSSLINLLTNLFIGMSIGANVLVARFFGAGEKKELHETVHTAVALGVVSGLILTIVGIAFAKPILLLMKTPTEVLDLSVLYLRTYFLGMTSTMVYNFCSSILRAVGDTKRPLYYLMLSGMTNVVLNLVFVLVFHLDVMGVGLATAISQTVSVLLILRCLILEKESYRLKIRKVRFYRKQLKRILQIGLPAGLQGCVFSLSNVVIQSSVNSFGAVAMAGNAAAANVEGFIYVAMNAFHQAAVSFISQNFGAGKFGRINKIIIRTIAMVAVTGFSLGGMALLFGKILLGIFSADASVIEMGMVRMSIICVYYAFCGLMDVMVGVLRGLGYSVMPMIVSLLGACGLRILWIFTVFRIPAYHNMRVLYYSYPVSWIITFLVHLSCYFVVRRKFPRNDVVEEPESGENQGESGEIRGNK